MNGPQRTVPVGRSPRLDGPAWTDVSWQDRANCAGTTDSGMWFPSVNHPNRRQERTAKAICGRCLVRDACLAWALEVDDRWAILGQTTPTERANIGRRERDRIWRKARRAAR